jgi:hypothetical protein
MRRKLPCRDSRFFYGLCLRTHTSLIIYATGSRKREYDPVTEVLAMPCGPSEACSCVDSKQSQFGRSQGPVTKLGVQGNRISTSILEYRANSMERSTFS